MTSNADRALIQRINRKLKPKGQRLKIARGEAAKTEVGDYYVIDTSRNFLVLTRVNLESLGRELDVLGEG